MKSRRCKLEYTDNIKTSFEVKCGEIRLEKEKNEYKIYTRGKQGGWSGPTIEHNKQKAIDIVKNSKQGNKDLEIIVIEHNKEKDMDIPIDIERE